MKVLWDTLQGSCGTYYLSGFNDSWGTPLKDISLHEGSGVTLANFVNTKPCRDVYEELSKTYNIIFQDIPRYNKNSGREGFLCLFDTSKRKAK